MSTEPRSFLKKKAVNGWRLFWLIAGPISIIMIAAVIITKPDSGPAVSAMIQFSVRIAVPLLYLVFAASSILLLFPGPLGLWVSRNRKFLGLSFAAAMAWQGLFIVWLVIFYREYYISEVYVLRDAIEGSVGYLFLLAMTVTSFTAVRRRVKKSTWKRLHKSGIYFLWAYAFSVYWWNLFYYGHPLLLDYVYYWGGFAAWALRAVAWSKKRREQAQKESPAYDEQPAVKFTGYALIGFGLIAASLGSVWQASAQHYLTGYTLTRWPELYLPYWPFEPFLALFIVAAGIFLLTKSVAMRYPSQPPRTSSGTKFAR
jgi:DMSO/TMAO reductase YedYZ heme-binding membrane subunit